MMGVRRLGFVLLYLGFFGAVLVAVRQSDSVGAEWATIEWGWYGIMFLIGVVGVVLLRTTAKNADTQSHKLESDIATIQESLRHIVDKLGRIKKDRDTISVYDVGAWIDDVLVENLGELVEARESLIHVYGLQQYANLMSRFALGERNLNRAWSASADGYIDEVWSCIGRAEREMTAARSLLAEYQQRPK